MPPIKQTPRTFSPKIARHKRVRRVDYAIVNQARQRITCPKVETIRPLTNLERNGAIETISGRDQLFELTPRRIRPQPI
jgi:hypothetical protein